LDTAGHGVSIEPVNDTDAIMASPTRGARVRGLG
jgi:hypothetical protein